MRPVRILDHDSFGHLLGKCHACALHVHNDGAIEMRNDRDGFARQKAHVLQMTTKVAAYFELLHAVITGFSQLRQYQDDPRFPLPLPYKSVLALVNKQMLAGVNSYVNTWNEKS